MSSTDALRDARAITLSLRNARRTMEYGVLQADTAVNILKKDGDTIKQTLETHKYELRSSLDSAKGRLKRIKNMQYFERLSLRFSVIFFCSVVFYIVAKRLRILSVGYYIITNGIPERERLYQLFPQFENPTKAFSQISHTDEEYDGGNYPQLKDNNQKNMQYISIDVDANIEQSKISSDITEDRSLTIDHGFTSDSSHNDDVEEKMYRASLAINKDKIISLDLNDKDSRSNYYEKQSQDVRKADTNEDSAIFEDFKGQAFQNGDTEDINSLSYAEIDSTMGDEQNDLGMETRVNEMEHLNANTVGQISEVEVSAT